MNKKSMKRILNEIAAGVLLGACVICLSGCTKADNSDDLKTEPVANTAEDINEEAIEKIVEKATKEVIEDYPDNEFEARVNKFSFDSYDEIVGLLEGSEGYAYIKMMGSDEDILLVADEVFDLEDGETMAAICVTPYIKDAEGKYVGGSLMPGDDNDFPLKVNNDGIVFVVRNNGLNSIEGMALGSNGTGVMGIMDMFSVMNSENHFIGFSRTENTVVDNDGEQIDTDDPTFYNEKMAEYMSLKPINFTAADGTVAKPFDVSTIAGSYVSFCVEEFDMGDGINAITTDERLIISPKGTGVISIQDIIPISKITGTSFTDEGGYTIPYVYVDGAIITTDQNIPMVYVKSNIEVGTDSESIEALRYDYCYPKEEDTKAVAGTYKHAYAEEIEGEWCVFYDELNVLEDGSATTLFQDVGPSFKVLENGLAMGDDGSEYPCIISKDVISIDFDRSGIYIPFVRTEQ